MKPRRIYWRKKGKGIALEGRSSTNKCVLIWSLPDADKFVNRIMENATILTQEKVDEIRQRYLRLDFKKESKPKPSSKIRLLNIKRSQNKDAPKSFDDEVRELSGDFDIM